MKTLSAVMGDDVGDKATTIVTHTYNVPSSSPNVCFGTLKRCYNSSHFCLCPSSIHATHTSRFGRHCTLQCTFISDLPAEAFAKN